MTRPDQKQEEREIVERLLPVIGLRAEIDDKGDKPDIVLKVANRTIGVEVTAYASATAVASASGKSIARRAIEAAWEDLETESKRFRSERPDLKDIGVIFFFKMGTPPKKKYSEFLSEIREFIRSKRSSLGCRFRFMVNGGSRGVTEAVKRVSAGVAHCHSPSLLQTSNPIVVKT